MSRLTRTAALALALGAVSSALGACQALAGIEDRHYQPVAADAGAAGASDDAPPSQECIDYCSKAKTACNKDLNGSEVEGGILYLADDACLKTCSHMPLVGADQNSVACRMQQLVFVDTGEEVETYCANAGPGGNGACGSNCENYCHLFASACKDDFKKYSMAAEEGDDGTAVCVKKCLGLWDTELFSSTKDAAGNYYGDTVQCRLVHTCSSMLDPDTHCSHADLRPSMGKCEDKQDGPPECKKFCRLAIQECLDFPVYEDDPQCEAVCEALDKGQLKDQTGNTVGCRMYHSYNSALDPKTHCSHTGPGGDGHCFDGDDPDAGNCQAYCQLLHQGCKSEFDAKFDDEPACQAECVKLDGAAANSGSPIGASGNNLQCRLLNVSRALANPTNPTKLCAAALGAAPCR